MKRSYFYFSVAAALAMLSCTTNNEENRPAERGETITLTSLIVDNDPSTRAVMGTLAGGQYAVTFEASDKLRLISDQNGVGESGVEFTTSTGGATAQFENAAGITGTTFNAIFPSSAASFNSSNVALVTIPSVQTYSANTFPKDGTLMVGQTTTSTLALKHVGGLWRLSLKGDVAGRTVTSILLKVADTNNPIAGKFEPNFVTGALSAATSSSRQIELRCGSGVTLSTTAATDFYFALAPGSYSGFAITIMLADGKYMYKNVTATMNIARAAVTAPDVALTFTEKSTLSGTGTVADPYQINGRADWNLFVSTVNVGSVDYEDEYVKLYSDIDFSGATFTQVGTVSKRFIGTFDGNDHTMSNISYSGGAQSSLFRSCQSIVNLKIDNAAIVSTLASPSAANSSLSAVLVGSLTGTIDNCTITNSTVTANSSKVGIVCGDVTDGAVSNSKVSNCQIIGGTTTNAESIGLIAGYALQSNLTGCVAKSSTIGGYDQLGGIVGYAASSNITDCLSKGNTINIATGGYAAGGVVGNIFTSTIVSGCLSKENTINGGSQTGGIFGRLSISSRSGRVANCISDGNILSGTNTIGGVGGLLSKSDVVNTLSKNCKVTATDAVALAALAIGSLSSDSYYKNNLILSGEIQHSSGAYKYGIVSGASGQNSTNCTLNYYPSSLRSTVDRSTTGAVATLYAFGAATSGAASSDGTSLVTASTDAAITGGALLTTLNTNVSTLNSSYSGTLINWTAGTDLKPTFPYEATILAGE
ncbi:MAG: hypothetical protein SOZ00_07080 [Tidjanibacter sp.]|nr:hypothetical protein [Tidjanibacter sp.]